MLEKGQNGMVWRPMFAPMPVKNLVVEPVAVWLSASSGWITDEVMNLDAMTLTVEVLMRNTSNRDLSTLAGVVEVHVGQVLLGTFSHQGGMAKGATMQHAITASISAKDSQAARALFDGINAQDPSVNPIVSVMVTGDFHAPLGGPMGKFTVANQAVSIKNLTINRRSGSPVRTLTEV